MPQTKAKKADRMKKYNEANKEQRAVKSKAYREANKEKISAQSKTYSQANKEKIAAYDKARKLKNKYNLTIEQHKQMLEDQGNCCSICDEVMTKPCVDHNHDTGVVRELLCSECNTAFGLFKENPRVLEKAAMYARFHNGVK